MSLRWPPDVVRHRPAPAHVVPPAPFSKVPDGWEPVDSRRIARLLNAADETAIFAMRWMANQIDRRGFLKRVVGAGLTIGVAGSEWLWGPLPNARADLPCNYYGDLDPPDENPGACGPSEPCGDVECDGANEASCNAGHVCDNNVVVKGRDTFGTPHDGCGPEWSWTECCPNGRFKCTDCCGCKVHGSGKCPKDSCVNPDPHYKCICDGQIANNC